MAIPRQLKQAPIREAMIDIRVKRANTATLEKLSSLGKQIEATYPNKQEYRTRSVKIDLIRDPELTVNRIDGYLYTSGNSLQVVQYRLDGFTFHRLKPYESWNNMRTEAIRLWDLYRKCVSPEEITRIALRYVNDLEFPFPTIDLGDYLTCPPSAPKELLEPSTRFVMGHFFNRLVIRDTSTEAEALIFQESRTTAQENQISILLDIEVRKLCKNEETIWNILDHLRHWKNQIFFASITEKAVELYQ